MLAGRRKSIAFFIALGAGLILVILLLYIGWVLLNWRNGILLVLGVLLLATIIGGVVLNTIFLVDAEGHLTGTVPLARLFLHEGSTKLMDLAPDQVMMAAAHNADLGNARKCGLQTAFFARPNEYGPNQKRDFKADQEWDIVAKDIEDLATQLGV